MQDSGFVWVDGQRKARIVRIDPLGRLLLHRRYALVVLNGEQVWVSIRRLMTRPNV